MGAPPSTCRRLWTSSSSGSTSHWESRCSRRHLEGNEVDSGRGGLETRLGLDWSCVQLYALSGTGSVTEADVSNPRGIRSVSEARRAQSTGYGWLRAASAFHRRRSFRASPHTARLATMVGLEHVGDLSASSRGRPPPFTPVLSRCRSTRQARPTCTPPAAPFAAAADSFQATNVLHPQGFTPVTCHTRAFPTSLGLNL